LHGKALALLTAVLIASQTLMALGAQSSTCPFRLRDVYWQDAGLLRVVLENVGDSAVENVTATLNITTMTLDEETVNDSYAGTLKPGQTVYFTFPVNVPAHAKASYYNFTLSLEYTQGGSERECELPEPVPVTVNGVPDLTVACNTTVLLAGSENVLELSEVNDGDGVARRVAVSLTPLTGMTVVGANSFTTDLMAPGEVWNFTFTALVGSQPASLRVDVSYWDQLSILYVETFILGFDVKSTLETLVDVVPLNDTLKPNSENAVTLSVENVGEGALKNVTVALYSQTQAAVVLGSNTRRIDLLDEGSSEDVAFDVFVQPGVCGAIPMTVALTFFDEEGRYYQYSYMVGYTVRGYASIKVSKTVYTPAIVFPGDQFVVVELYLTNVGDYYAEDVEVVYPEVPGLVKASYAGSNEAVVPYLPVGEVASVVFMVDVCEGAEPGWHKVPLSVSHDGLNYTVDVMLTVREKARFTVSDVVLSGKPTPGMRGVRVTMKLSNEAGAEAEDVVVSVVSPYITGSTVSNIGTIGANSSAVAVFEVDFDENTPPGTLEVEVTVSWTQEGRTLSQSLTVPIEVYEKHSLSPAVAVAVAAAVAAAAGVYIALKRRS